MKKYIIIIIILSVSCSKKNEQSKYISVLIKSNYDSSIGFEDEDTIECLNQKDAAIKTISNYFISKSSDEKFKLYKTLDYKLLDINKKPILISKILSNKQIDSIQNIVTKSLSNYENKNIKVNVNNQFSSFDGSHIKLTEYIKETLNDPDSYEHVETKYKLKDKYIHVIVTFRGANKFGSIITKTLNANCDLYTGNVLKVY